MDSKTIKARDFSLDNIRFVLIFLVVFAHLLEGNTLLINGYYVYQFIYTFHIPVFIFLFGYNAKYSLKKIIFHWTIPYFVFQNIYILFQILVLKNNAGFQYTTPYWLLWYMLTCIFYQLLLPLFDTTNKNKQIILLLLTFVISIFVGFIKHIGYFMSLSRFFVFLPYFLLGYYCKKNSVLDKCANNLKLQTVFLFLSIIIIISSILLLRYANIPNSILYGSCSYLSCKGSPWMRIIIFLIALGWISFLFIGVKSYLNKEVPLLTKIGKNTWSIFLLHGFIVKIVQTYYPCLISSYVQLVLISCIILLVTGNKRMNKAINIIGCSWTEKIFRFKNN